VAERSGYSAPTIYHHFGDKNGLIDALLDARFGEVLEVMRAVPKGEDAAGYLREIARAFVRFAIDNPSHYRLLSVPFAHHATRLRAGGGSHGARLRDGGRGPAQDGDLFVRARSRFGLRTRLGRGRAAGAGA
jgi:AcrR family transcriptional regulator